MHTKSSVQVKPRVALVGCGAVVQQYYVPTLSLLERGGTLEVSALCDPDAAMRARVRHSFSRARELQDFTDVQQVDAELVILASPPRFHAAQATELLRQGRAVLCEKPLAASAAEAQMMVDAAGAASGILAAGMLRRFFPATQVIRDLLSTGALGEIVSFDIQEGTRFHWPVSSPAYFTKRSSAGGVLMDIGAHALDLLIWWLGEPIETLYEDDAMGGVEANCRLRCRFGGGVSGEVRLSRDWDLANRYVLRGTRGAISWSVNEANRLELSLDSSPYTLNAQVEESRQAAAHFERAFISQILNVLAAMRGEEPLQVHAADALPSLRLIEHCYANRSLMPMGWLDPSEVARATRLNAGIQ